MKKYRYILVCLKSRILERLSTASEMERKFIVISTMYVSPSFTLPSYMGIESGLEEESKELCLHHFQN